jgi:hypothetical protein
LRKGNGMAVIMVGWISAHAAGCAEAPSQRPAKLGPVDTGAGSVESTRRDLAGHWTLGSLEIIGADGVRQTVKAHGTISYDAFGSLIINGVIDSARLTNAVVLNYSGRIVIDAAKHPFYPADFESDKPVESSRIAPISLDKVRRYDLAGDRFTVTYLDVAGKRQPSRCGIVRDAECPV